MVQLPDDAVGQAELWDIHQLGSCPSHNAQVDAAGVEDDVGAVGIQVELEDELLAAEFLEVVKGALQIFEGKGYALGLAAELEEAVDVASAAYHCEVFDVRGILLNPVFNGVPIAVAYKAVQEANGANVEGRGGGKQAFLDEAELCAAASDVDVEYVGLSLKEFGDKFVVFDEACFFLSGDDFDVYASFLVDVLYDFGAVGSIAHG